LLDELRERIAMFLSAHRVGVLCTSGRAGAWAMPVRYVSAGLDVACYMPRWADAAYYVEQDPHALLIVHEVLSGADDVCWLQYQGTVKPAESGGSTGETPALGRSPALYQVVRLSPCRIDILDTRLGWGARETLEL